MLQASPVGRYVSCAAAAVFLGLLMPLTTAQAAVSVASPLVLELAFPLPDVGGASTTWRLIAAGNISSWRHSEMAA